MPCEACSARHADDAARGAREDRVLALEHLGIREAARRLHEEQLHARHFAGHLVHIAAQDGREVGVHHRGVTPAHQLHHGAGGVRCAHLREARFARNACGGFFVRGVAVAVHEHDGCTAQARVVGRPQPFLQVRFVQRLDHIAMSAHALLRLDHALVQQLGQHDVAVKDAWAVLVGDAQRVLEALGSDEQRGLALTLQQRVGGHRGTHLHALHQVGRHRFAGREAQQVANARHGRVLVLLGVLGQQLVRDQGPVRALAHHIGEGASSVDPELPAWGGIEGCGHGLLYF